MATKRKPESAPAGEPAQAFGAAVGDIVKSMAGLNLPMQLNSLQGDYLKNAAEIWNQTLQRMTGGAESATKIADRRFADQAWLENPAAAYTAQMYLLNARTLLQMAEGMQGDEKTKARVRFAVQQWIDAASPSNFLAFNPEAQAKALQTKGESIASGLQHLLADLQKGHVSQTDESVFEVGRNVATSAGSVVSRVTLAAGCSPRAASTASAVARIVPPTQKPRVSICACPLMACTSWMARIAACSM